MKVWWASGCLLLALAVSLGAGGGEGGKKSKADFEAFFKKLDGNMDGKLSRDEFLRMADRAKEKEQAKQKLGQAYDKIDPEKKGVTKDQFRRYLDSAKNGAADPKSSS